MILLWVALGIFVILPLMLILQALAFNGKLEDAIILWFHRKRRKR